MYNCNSSTALSSKDEREMLSIYMGVLYLTIIIGSVENRTENSVNPAPNTLQNGDLEFTNFRLVNGPSFYQGRVQILYAGTWNSVCNVGFGDVEATVLCRSLGYSGGKLAFYGGVTDWILHSNLTCDGSEYSLNQCGYFSIFPQCKYGQAVGVDCDPSNIEFRLTGSSDFAGRVEVFYNQTWGTICSDQPIIYVDNNAHVVCRSLGLSGGKFIESSEKGSGPIWLADLECTGNEYSPVLCPFFGWGDTGCTHQFDMAVECSPPEGCTKCVHKASCNEIANTCRCKKGWSGGNCDQDINECDDPHRYYCPPDSTCRNIAGSYFCERTSRVCTSDSSKLLFVTIPMTVIILALVGINIYLCYRKRHLTRGIRRSYETVISQPSLDENASNHASAIENHEEASIARPERPTTYGTEGYGASSNTDVKSLC